jgi:hypothetical protein
MWIKISETFMLINVSETFMWIINPMDSMDNGSMLATHNLYLFQPNQSNRTEISRHDFMISIHWIKMQ